MIEEYTAKKIAAAIRTEDDFSTALKSRVDVIFLLYSNIINVGDRVKAVHDAGILHKALKVRKKAHVLL